MLLLLWLLLPLPACVAAAAATIGDACKAHKEHKSRYLFFVASRSFGVEPFAMHCV
jgi:hypothetical protein